MFKVNESSDSLVGHQYYFRNDQSNVTLANKKVVRG